MHSSAIAADRAISKPGDIPAISIVQLPAAMMINLRGPGDDPSFAQRAARLIGLPLPTTPNLFFTAHGRYCLWLGPDEWLIIDRVNMAHELSRMLDDGLADFHHAVTDVSGNRATLRVSGSTAAELLSVGCSFDLDLHHFKRGMAAQTLLARTPVILMRPDDRPVFDILTRRSLVRYLQSWLIQAAGSVG